MLTKVFVLRLVFESSAAGCGAARVYFLTLLACGFLRQANLPVTLYFRINHTKPLVGHAAGLLNFGCLPKSFLCI